MEMKNSLFTIFPYKLNGQWVFDDERVGLYHEPFVCQADVFLDKISGGKEQVTAIFSDKYFPSARWVIEKIKKDEVFSGAWYYSKDFDMELWLCDATLLYFNPHPDKLFIEIIK